MKANLWLVSCSTPQTGLAGMGMGSILPPNHERLTDLRVRRLLGVLTEAESIEIEAAEVLDRNWRAEQQRRLRWSIAGEFNVKPFGRRAK